MQDVRWKQRFQNFERAYLLLRSALEGRETGDLTDLEQEGVVQRFEYTFELAWNTLKDYLIFSGVELVRATPRDTIKEAYSANLINDGQTWVDMLEHRNLMSHTYNHQTFVEAIDAIKTRYLKTLGDVYLFLKEKSGEEWKLD